MTAVEYKCRCPPVCVRMLLSSPAAAFTVCSGLQHLQQLQHRCPPEPSRAERSGEGGSGQEGWGYGGWEAGGEGGEGGVGGVDESGWRWGDTELLYRPCCQSWVTWGENGKMTPLLRRNVDFSLNNLDHG